MAFKNGISDHKISINLSKNAEMVMENDMFCFGETVPAKYLNNVFENFHADANASIEIAAEHYSDSLDLALKDAKINKSDLNQIKSALIESYKYQKQAVTKGYERGESRRIYLRKETESYLMDGTPDSSGTFCNEEKNYKSLRDYFKAVIEEYSTLPYASREKIYNYENLKVIESAISNQHAVGIDLKSGESFLVKGYVIKTDSQSVYHYLAGLAAPTENREKDNFKIMSFRLSNIKYAREFRSISGFLSQKEKKEIENQIHDYGIQFLSSGMTEAIIEFSNEGLKKYHDLLFLRPAYEYIDQEDPHKYYFKTTPTQLEFYFFKYGEDAKILKPKWLSDKMKKMYSNALNNYS